MLLQKHTPKEITERKALTVNPAKTCQPIGAMYAALGIHGCLPHSHGSQGCCAYHRSMLTRHYKDPIMAGTSSFTEGSSVFGGQSNLLAALTNMFTIYEPDLVAIHTTCLSETIGDDMAQIVKKANDDGRIPEGKKVIYCNTPSYVGSHITGFANMCSGIVKGLVEHTGEAKEQVNILPGWVEPSDMKEMKRIAAAMGIKYVMFPDTDGVVDTPQTGEYKMYPDGGAKVEDIATAGDSIKTLACGPWASTDAAKLMDSKCKVPYEVIDIPVGLSATDRFVQALAEAAKVSVPDSFITERGKLVDLITDMSQYLHGKKVALCGDPDQLMPLTEFLLDLDMIPTHIVSGTPGKKMSTRITEMCAEKGIEVNVKNGERADQLLLSQWIKNEPVDLILGNTWTKMIARDEDIPFVRYGFPIIDRVGHSHFPTVGYTGGMNLLVKILDVLMERQERDAPDTGFELVM